ncbi:unnamed protein product, partial [Polarella glacialis]
LNQDVQLCRKVGAFERDFANGYLFGELLQRHGLLNSFEDDFVDEKTLSAKRTNFELLKDALKGGPASSLGVRLGEEQVAEIMDEDRGASLRLLYQLRRGLLNKGQGGVAVTSGGGTAQEATRLIRQKKGEKEEQFFETRLKKLGKLDDRLRYEMHNKNFADEHAQQMKSSADKEYQDTAAIRGRVHDFKSSLHEKMQQSKTMKGEAKAKGELHWQGVQEKKLRLMEKDLTFEKEMIRRDHQRILDIREHYQKDCGYAETDEAGGIAWFEKNLQRIGIDTSEHAGSTGAAIEASSLKELHEKMIEKLPTKAQLQIESSKRMDKIREAKRNTDVARKERERRQHRVQVEQQATQVAVEEQKGEDDLLSWLLSETAAYRREASDFELQERRKEALWNQREAKQLAYAERAEQESEEAYTKMAARAREERSLKLTLRQEEQERTKLRQAAGMHDPLADDAQSEESSDGEEHDPLGLNADSLSQRSRHTASSAVLPADGPIPEVPEPLLVASAEELSFCVREAAISEYLFARGAWTRHQPSEAETVEILQRALQMPGEASQASSAAPRLGSVVQWLCQSPPKELAEVTSTGSRSRSVRGFSESERTAPSLKAASDGSSREHLSPWTVAKAEVFCRACHSRCPLSCRVCPLCESAPSFSLTGGDFNLKGVLKVLFDGRGGGAGASNLVLLGHNLDQQQRVVVKAARLKDDAEEVATLREEIQIQRRLAHDNLVPLFYAAETPSEVLLVTPFAAGGDLHAALGACRTLPEKQVSRLCSQLLAGLGHLHEELHILHGDVKPRNIFLVPSGHAFVAQLGDFGLSREVPRQSPSLCAFRGLQGSHGYMAPEIIARNDYGCSVDIFALGVIIFTLLGGYEPFYPPSNVTAPLEFDEQVWGKLSEASASFVSALLLTEVEERATAAAARASEWLRDDSEADDRLPQSSDALEMSALPLTFHRAANVQEVLAAVSG